jgi:hypothetical protein
MKGLQLCLQSAPTIIKFDFPTGGWLFSQSPVCEHDIISE